MNLNFIKHSKNKLQILFLLMLSFVCNAQNAGDVGQGFGSASPVTPTIQGFEPAVYAIVFQPDGKKIVGGAFAAYNGTVAKNIVRLNPDNTIDTSFDTGVGFDNSVTTIALRADGKIFVGGYFTTYKGLPQKYMILLNTDGTKDVSFNAGFALEQPVQCVLFQPDGKIIVGGDFYSFNGSTQNHIIRLHSNGSKDTTFSIGTGFNNDVKTMALQTDGKIVIGGTFTSYNGMSANCIVRLNANGSKDNLFNSGLGFNSSVNSMTLQSNGKMVIGGHFTSYNGVSAIRIARLNADGTKDASFNTGTGFDNSVHSITMYLEDKILVGGNFTIYKDVAENGIICLNNDGTKNFTFNTGTGFLGGVFDIATHTDGKVGVGGWFSHYNGLPVNKIITLNPDGTQYIPPAGLNNNVTTITSQPDGKVIVGGHFTSYKNTTENRIIRLNPDSTKDTSFNIGTGFNGTVYATALQPDGKVIVGGSFTTYNGMTENRIIRVNPDGTKDATFNAGTGFSDTVLSIVVQPNGKIIVVGRFTMYNGLPQNRIIRLNTDGSKDATFTIGTGLNGVAEITALQPDGKILIGGQFTAYNGTNQNRITRLNTNGTVDTTFNIGTGFDNFVYAIAPQPDGMIVVGGDFYAYKGIPESKIIRLNTDGSKDASFLTGTGFSSYISTIKLQLDGKIVIGGGFTSYKGGSANRIIRLNSDGTKDADFNFGLGFDDYVYTIEIKSNKEIVVGGGFTSYNNTASARLITLYGDSLLSTAEVEGTATVSLWPNPVQNILHIRNLDTSGSLKIYNLQGKLVYENTDLAESIDVSSLASGLYMVILQTEKGRLVKKFIKS